MAKGVTFGNVHTSSFGVFLSSVEIGTAEVKKNKIDIPGASGSLDLTEFLGRVCYGNRELKFEFTFPQRNSALLSAYSAFQVALHGKHFESIILDDDTSHRYVGRVSVGELKKDVISSVSVVCDCNPFKYSTAQNSVVISVTGVEYPSWTYGDVNGDGVIDSRDLTAVTALSGKKSFESLSALRADFNFDGEVSDAEKNILNWYLLYGSGTEFKNYALSNSAFFETLRNCKRCVIDFGEAPVKVKFTRLGSDHTRLWDLRIDNISQFGLHGYSEYSVILSGSHEVMITTANTNTTGEFSVTWDGVGVL